MLRALTGLALALAACGGGARDLSTEELNAVVERERPSLKTCYDAALEKHPYREVLRLNAVIRVAPDGSVSAVELDEEGLPGMGDCLRKAIGGWAFPKAEAPTSTSLPLIFRPEVGKDVE